MGLFGGGTGPSEPEPELGDIGEWDNATRLEAEHEVVGFYISGHPLDRYTADLGLVGAVPTRDLGSMRDQEKVALAGITNTVRRKNSRKGERYATFNLEDRDGIIEVIAWPGVYRSCETAIIGKQPVLVSGTLELGDSGSEGAANENDAPQGNEAPSFARKAQVIADEVVALTEARRRRARAVDIRLHSDTFQPERIDQLKTTLGRYPGSCRPYLKITRPGASETVIELPEDLNVDPSDRFLQEVEALAGPGSAVVR
jgi:DNA polymerase-3 subunit alpha